MTSAAALTRHPGAWADPNGRLERNGLGLVVTVPDTSFLQALTPAPDGVDLRAWDVAAPAAASLGPAALRVHAVVLPSTFDRTGFLPALAELPSLRLVQVLSAGVEDLQGRLPEGVQLANGAGVREASTAELAIALVLASLRGLPEVAQDQRQRRWRPWQEFASLVDRRVLLLGTGNVGASVAHRLRAFDVDLVRVASRARADEAGVIHSTDELPDLLPTVDVVIVAAPLNDRTRGLLDADALAALPDGALLVNVGRGPIVDTGALMAELRAGRLRAALDVVDPEPLPEDHPLWHLPGVVLTPHLGGVTTAVRSRELALLRQQLRRLADGLDPLNVVLGSS